MRDLPYGDEPIPEESEESDDDAGFADLMERLEKMRLNPPQ